MVFKTSHPPWHTLFLFLSLFTPKYHFTQMPRAAAGWPRAMMVRGRLFQQCQELHFCRSVVPCHEPRTGVRKRRVANTKQNRRGGGLDPVAHVPVLYIFFKYKTVNITRASAGKKFQLPKVFSKSYFLSITNSFY